MSCIACHARDVIFDLFDQLNACFGIIHIPVSRDLCNDLASPIDPGVELPPVTLSPFTVLCSRLFTLADDGESGAIDDQIDGAW